jgi:hypothetical protein
LRVGNYVKSCRDMFNCSEKGLHSAFPKHSIWKTLYQVTIMITHIRENSVI